MSSGLIDDELVATLERDAGLEPGLLALLLALEGKFTDLNARGARKELFRSVASILDEAADRTEAT